MVDVFLSYSREDQERARVVVEALVTRGLSVFWDRNIQPGKQWARVIEKELDASKCTVVLWSRAAVKSKWVTKEARDSLHKLVPVLIDEVSPPDEFNHIQAARLLDETRFGASELSSLIRAIVLAVHGGQQEHALEPAAPLRGVLLLAPVRCAEHPLGSAQGGANEGVKLFAAGLRKDLLGSMAHETGLTTALHEHQDPPPIESGHFDFFLNSMLRVEGADAHLSLHLGIFANGIQVATVEETLARTDSSEWGLQELLVEGAASQISKWLSDRAPELAESTTQGAAQAENVIAHCVATMLRGSGRHLLVGLSGLRRVRESTGSTPLLEAALAMAKARKFLVMRGRAAYLDEAREHISIALSASPNFSPAIRALGLVEELAHNHDQAREHYRLAIRLNDGDGRACHGLGSSLARAGDLEEARALLQRSVDLSGDNVRARDDLLGVFMTMGLEDEALELAEGSIIVAELQLGFEADDPATRFALAKIHARAGDRSHARRILTMALETHSRDGYSLFESACVQALLGDQELALEALKQSKQRGYFIKGAAKRTRDLSALQDLLDFQAMIQ